MWIFYLANRLYCITYAVWNKTGKIKAYFQQEKKLICFKYISDLIFFFFFIKFALNSENMSNKVNQTKNLAVFHKPFRNFLLSFFSFFIKFAIYFFPKQNSYIYFPVLFFFLNRINQYHFNLNVRPKVIKSVSHLNSECSLRL